jgi:RimJ/RimL family protein N-acetyltransferase
VLKELKSEAFAQAGHLFQGFDYSLSIQAAIEGNNPGRLFVDDVDRPRTAFALTVEGYLLAGAHDDPATIDALRRLWREKIFSGQVFVNGDCSMSLAVHPETWEALLPDLVPSHEVEKLDRYHYLCRRVAVDWRALVPAGYAIRRLDRALWQRAPAEFTATLRDWNEVEATWGTLDNFWDKGVSFCAIHDGRPVAWCFADCVAGDRIDLGIFTAAAHRRLGLATAVAAATAEYCLDHGFRLVGWHCNAENVASWKTAEKVGFERNRAYAYYYYMYDPIDHLAELGWYYYKRGEYARTVAYYDRVFAQRPESPDYYYHLTALAWAALGDEDKALHFLGEAVDRGWDAAQWTMEQEAFRILHGRPEWSALLERMAEVAGD